MPVAEAEDTGIETIKAFLPLSECLATSGQPTVEQFAAIRAEGYETIVNLVPPTVSAYLAEEEAAVAALGMEYINIPVIWQGPTREDLDRFFAVMDARRQRKVFVHCAANKRVSAFLFLYRVLRLGMDETDAEDDMERIWQPEGVWREFIEDSLRAKR